MQIMQTVIAHELDDAPRPAIASVPGRKVVAKADRAIVYHVTSIRVDSRQLLADLDEEARRIFGPSRPTQRADR